MKRHIRGVHEGKKSFICTFEECEEAYSQKINLQRHISSFHEKIKAFKCAKCPADFVRKEDFRRHKARKHGTQEKIFECDECNTKFKTKEYLKKHITALEFMED